MSESRTLTIAGSSARRMQTLSSRSRPPRKSGMSPVDSSENLAQLRGRQRDRAVLGRGPDEMAMVEGYGVERPPKTVMPEDLDRYAAAPV